MTVIFQKSLILGRKGKYGFFPSVCKNYHSIFKRRQTKETDSFCALGFKKSRRLKISISFGKNIFLSANVTINEFTNEHLYQCLYAAIP